MVDYLGNNVEIGDTAVTFGRQGFIRGVVTDTKYELFEQGDPVGVARLDLPGYPTGVDVVAAMTIVIPDKMLPEKRREQLNNVEEGVQVS